MNLNLSPQIIERYILKETGNKIKINDIDKFRVDFMKLILNDISIAYNGTAKDFVKTLEEIFQENSMLVGLRFAKGNIKIHRGLLPLIKDKYFFENLPKII